MGIRWFQGLVCWWLLFAFGFLKRRSFFKTVYHGMDGAVIRCFFVIAEGTLRAGLSLSADSPLPVTIIQIFYQKQTCGNYMIMLV